MVSVLEKSGEGIGNVNRYLMFWAGLPANNVGVRPRWQLYNILPFSTRGIDGYSYIFNVWVY